MLIKQLCLIIFSETIYDTILIEAMLSSFVRANDVFTVQY